MPGSQGSNPSPWRKPLLALLIGLSATVALAQSGAGPVDFQKARALMERQRAGESLTSEEKGYLERAKSAYAANGNSAPEPKPAGEIDWDRARNLYEREQKGEKLSADEQTFLQKAKELRKGRSAGLPNAAANQRKAPEHLPPLCDLSATDRYEGQDGGLYGGGLNTPPEPQRKAALAELAQIRPLNPEGKVSAEGKIVLISISMSNATQEFSAFKRIADEDPRKSPALTIVDCAQGGQAMAQWVPPDARAWSETQQRLARAGVTAQQVQVAWIKLANVMPSGTLQEHGKKLEADTLAVLHNARALFPNLRIAYLGSRTYGGYSTTPLNPEPYAFESAFPVRWLIERQIKGEPELAAEKSPLLLWGPYFWADGTRGRKFDSLVWERSDFSEKDGTHPSETGRQKVAQMLLAFFTTDPLAKVWFLKK